MARREWLFVTTVRSASGGDEHEIKTDGEILGCDCHSWRFSSTPKTCRHVDEVLPYVQRAGGIPLVFRILRNGLSFEMREPVTVAPLPRGGSPVVPGTLFARIERLTLAMITTPTNGEASTRLRRTEWETLREPLRQALSGVSAAPVVPTASPDWLGPGGRAIVLRD